MSAGVGGGRVLGLQTRMSMSPWEAFAGAGGGDATWM